MLTMGPRFREGDVLALRVSDSVIPAQAGTHSE
jgi:hypothetical protein